MEINHVCSLGEFCQTASILKRNNLKLCSFPFDWIFSSYNNIIDCLEDDFKNFLNKSHYESVENDKCEHLYYDRIFFNHHNPLNNEKDYNYFERCVNRFRNLLNSNGTKLFIIFISGNGINENVKNDIINFDKRFSKFTREYKLLVIQCIYNQSTNNHFSSFIDNIHFLDLYISGKTNGVSFENESDNQYLDNIIKSNYDFILKPSY